MQQFMLKSRFLNPMNIKTHFWLLLHGLEIHRSRLLSVALPYIYIYFYADHRADHCQCLYVRFPGFFSLYFFFYYVVCKQVERLPLLVIKTMTLKSQTNIQINRQQDARICSCSPNYFGQPIKTWGKTFLKLF